MPSVPPVGHEAPRSSVLQRRGVPKLDGSAPAFIALVAILVVVTLISTAGIMYMLWDNRQQKDDKSARVRRYKSTGAKNSGWIARLGRVFGSRKPDPLHCRETSDKEMMQDWTHSTKYTSSTRDILATIREEQSEHQPENAYSTTDHTSGVTPSTRSPAVSLLDANHRVQRPPLSRSRTYASSHLSTSEGSVRSMSVASYPSRHDSFTSGPHMQPSIPSIAEHLVSPSLPSSSPSMSPSPLIQRLGSPDSFDTIYPNGRGRPFSTQSGTSITLEGGTKFREEL